MYKHSAKVNALELGIFVLVQNECLSMQGLIRFFISLLLPVFLYLNTNAQSSQQDISDASVINNVISVFDKAIGEQSHLYNGKEYINYPYQFSDGHPFFLWDNWQKGTILYDGTFYKDVSILYDIVRDAVVILHFNNFTKISLIKEKVRSFTLPGHTFIQVFADSSNSSFTTKGFYELLYAGKDSLLAKRTKKTQILYRQAVPELQVFAKDQYYFKKNNNNYAVNNERSFLHQLDNKRKDIRKYKKQNSLNFKKDPENTMIKIMSFYDQVN